MKTLLAFLLFALPLAGQTINPGQIRPSATNGQVLTTVGGSVQWSQGITLYLPPTTVANARALAAAQSIGTIWNVTDGTSSTDCTTGGGSTQHLCAWNGGALVNLSIGGATGPTGPTGPAGTGAYTVSTVSANVTASATAYQSLYRCGGTFTVTLPASPNAGQIVTVKNVGSGTITVVPNSGQTIDGSSSKTVPAGGTGIYPSNTFVWDTATSTWNII